MPGVSHVSTESEALFYQGTSRGRVALIQMHGSEKLHGMRISTCVLQFLIECHALLQERLCCHNVDPNYRRHEPGSGKHVGSCCRSPTAIWQGQCSFQPVERLVVVSSHEPVPPQGSAQAQGEFRLFVPGEAVQCSSEVLLFLIEQAQPPELFTSASQVRLRVLS